MAAARYAGLYFVNRRIDDLPRFGRCADVVFFRLAGFAGLVFGFGFGFGSLRSDAGIRSTILGFGGASTRRRIRILPGGSRCSSFRPSLSAPRR